MKEPLLEPLLRKMRLNMVLPYIQKYPDCSLLDIGCGWEARLLREIEPYISSGTGIDFKAPNIKTDKLVTYTLTLDEHLPFENNTFDMVTMLAVLEHLDNPKNIAEEIARVLKPGGGLMLTVPSWYAKPVLEFLAFKLGIVNPDEIHDHKRYFNKEDLYSFIEKIPGLEIVTHNYFQWRFNNFMFVTKKHSCSE